MLTQTLSRIKPPVAAGPNPAHPLARGLAGCWLLNESAGRTAHDVSGHHRNGSFSGAPLWTPGRCGPAVEFDGYDDWISMGDCLDLGTDDVTLFALVRYSAATQPEHSGGIYYAAVAGKGYLGPEEKGYGLFIRDNRVAWQMRNLTANFHVVSDDTLNDGQYHAAVGVCDRDNSTGLMLYIDGVRQALTADPTTLHGLDLSGPQAFALGSRRDQAGTWLFDFQGAVAAVYVWKRVLTEGAIRQLQRDPFALFARRRTPALLAARTPGVRDCAGAGAGRATLSATLQVLRRFAAVLETPAFWLREALFHGRTATAFKLGTALTGGWFWTRRQGCTAVYRGTALTQVDLSRVLYVTDRAAKELSLPACLSHVVGRTYGYLVRRCNSCGCQEQTTQAAVVVRLAPEGELEAPAPNTVMALKVEPAAGALRLTWFYCPLDQQAPPERFNVYWNGGDGPIDYENPAATVPYRARRFYCHGTETLAAGSYLFAAGAESATRVESAASAPILREVSDLPPATPTILVAQTT